MAAAEPAEVRTHDNAKYRASERGIMHKWALSRRMPPERHYRPFSARAINSRRLASGALASPAGYRIPASRAMMAMPSQKRSSDRKKRFLAIFVNLGYRVREVTK